MGNLHSGNSRFQQSLPPSVLDGMDGAVASLRQDAFGCEDGRKAASASATRPSPSCYRVREVLPASHQHPAAGGGWVLLTEPPARKCSLGGDVQEAEVDLRYSLEGEARRSWSSWRPIARC
jgi:hypothetical protein